MFRLTNGHFQGSGYVLITVISFHLRVYNHPPEYAHCRSEHVARVSCIYKLLSPCCCTVVGINTVKKHGHLEKKNNIQPNKNFFQKGITKRVY
jgi:hypothetical protein